MNNVDEQRESEQPELIVAPEPLGDDTDSGKSSLELLDTPHIDMQMCTSECDKGLGLPLHDRVA